MLKEQLISLSFLIILFAIGLFINVFFLENFAFYDNQSTDEIKITLEGKAYKDMTYGRLVLKNVDPEAEYKYFIIEPDDFVKGEGSPSTKKIKKTDIVKVTGVIKGEDSKCWWDEPEYGGCVPWVFIDKIEISN